MPRTSTNKAKKIAKSWTAKEMVENMYDRRKWKHQTTTEAHIQYWKLNTKLCKVTEKARDTCLKKQCYKLEKMQSR